MAYANTLHGYNTPGNCGNRSTAASIKALHQSAKSGNSVSSKTKPSRGNQPGKPLSALKSPRATKRPRD